MVAVKYTYGSLTVKYPTCGVPATSQEVYNKIVGPGKPGGEVTVGYDLTDEEEYASFQKDLVDLVMAGFTVIAKRSKSYTEEFPDEG